MGAKNSGLLVFLGCFGLLLNACAPDDEIDVPAVAEGAQVLIANQGNFGWGEGTLSVYYPQTKSIDHAVFKQANSIPLGNVFQSITKVNNSYYFVVNNSGRLVVTDSNFLEIARNNDFLSPRYFYQKDSETGYMTDLYANTIWVVDLKTGAPISQIKTNHWAENGVMLTDRFWYTAPETAKIFSVNTSTNSLQDSLNVGQQPESVVQDNGGNLWVLCRGDERMNETANLTRVSISGASPFAETIEVAGVPTSLTYDAQQNVLYYLADGVYRFKIGVDKAPRLWLEIPGAVLFSVAVNPYNGDIYISDSKDFVSRSIVYRYDKEGMLLDQFEAGIIAGYFFFP